MKLSVDIEKIKGFLDPEEGLALYDHALQASQLGPCLEIGSYCGKSTVYIGQACKETGQIVYAVDHHRGSEEQQLGEEYHDPDLFDSDRELVDSFGFFRQTIKQAGLEDAVVPLVSSSKTASKSWATPLAMVFIDGGHSMEAATADYECWSSHLLSGGVLAIHDIFPDPEKGGQAPYAIWKRALASGLFNELAIIKTLGILRRK